MTQIGDRGRRFSLATVAGSSGGGRGGSGVSSSLIASWLQKPPGRSSEATAECTSDVDDDEDDYDAGLTAVKPAVGAATSTPTTTSTPLVSRLSRRCSTIVDYVVGAVGNMSTSAAGRRSRRLDAVLEAGSGSVADDDDVDDRSVSDEGGFIGNAAGKRSPKLSKYIIFSRTCI